MRSAPDPWIECPFNPKWRHSENGIRSGAIAMRSCSAVIAFPCGNTPLRIFDAAEGAEASKLGMTCRRPASAAACAAVRPLRFSLTHFLTARASVVLPVP